MILAIEASLLEVGEDCLTSRYLMRAPRPPWHPHGSPRKAALGTRVPTMQTSEQIQKLAAEALGTFVLVLLGCGAAVTTGADVVATGLTFGITVLIGAY